MVDSMTFTLTTAVIYYPPAPTPDEKTFLFNLLIFIIIQVFISW